MSLLNAGDTIEAADFIRKADQSADPADDTGRAPILENDGRLHADFTMPAGIFFPFAGASADIPAGFLLCDGSAVSRTTYADLFAAIGTLWGAGNGTTTFNLPNLKGRVPVGYDSSQTEFETVAKQGGAKTHTLTTGEMPSHSHAGTLTSKNSVGTSSTRVAEGSDSGGAGGVNYTTGSAGAGGAHNNLQPYVAAHYIIKY